MQSKSFYFVSFVAAITIVLLVIAPISNNLQAQISGSVKDKKTTPTDSQQRLPNNTNSKLPGVTGIRGGGILSQNPGGTPPGQPGPSPATGHSYVFALDSLSITDTRSLGSDTNHATIQVQVDNGPIVKASKDLGDQNNGFHPIGLVLPPVTIPNGDHKLKFTFAINNGGTNFDIAKYASDILDGTLPGASQALSYLFPGLFSGGCNGPVAVLGPPFNYQPYVFTPGDLLAGGAKYTNTLWFPGIDSPSGCGSNSKYHVTYSITRIS